MGRANQLLGIGAFHPFESGIKPIRLLIQHATFGRYGTFTALDVAFPVCLTFLMDSHYRSPVLSLELQV